MLLRQRAPLPWPFTRLLASRMAACRRSACCARLKALFAVLLQCSLQRALHPCLPRRLWNLGLTHLVEAGGLVASMVA